ncbi:HdeD family acid-resistance protein [Calycomorphotria hydatis]|uniref:Acid-resistance membrane protein n=1 Tax=Calycomorphotria hydatis TaxID=2528027 RepID=A0A517TEX0_9PLAN|nr:HdeD family acid-resistance protein [Calycomorphotria hydatis]QDT66915.1 acid-resistance membrane protein [Calycomorphotria hydatis]
MPIASASLREIGLEDVKKNATWFLVVGALLVLFGMLAIGSPFVVGGTIVVFLGVLMLVGGIAQAGHAFARKEWSGFFIDLLIGLLYCVIGVMFMVHTGGALAILTLLIAISLILGGIFRVVAALVINPPHWFWILLNGVISLVLGILIFNQLPDSAMWVIGLFVGIDMLFNGWSLIFLGITAKNLPSSGGDEPTEEPATTDSPE